MAHITDLGFDMTDLAASVAAGDVRVQYHPEFPELAIYNYTEEVQFKNKWNNITLTCRGLILNTATGEVVARPWEKFFNFGQRDNRIDSDAPVEVTDKLDGSLGILYQRPDGDWSIATRGSFASDQAIHATEVLNNKHNDFLDHLKWHPKGLDSTLLFEIIYPDNRIVCNYGDMDDLVLLGAVSKMYGFYLGPSEANNCYGWDGEITQTWQYSRFVDALSFPDRQGKEGVVIRSGNKIVKLKQADYVELHRIVTNLSPKTIWEMLVAGKSQKDICVNLPDEFHGYVKDIADKLYMDFAGIKMQASIEFAEIKHFLWQLPGDGVSRRQWAEEIKKSKNPGLLFSLLDGKSIDYAVWQMVRPRGDIKNLVSDEGE